MTTATRVNDTLVEDPKVTGKEVARALCRVFGMPTDGVHRLTLTVECGGAATLTVDRLVRRSHIEGLKAATENYILAKEVEVDDE